MSEPGLRMRVVVVWIDWYAYHVARFRGLMSAPELAGSVAGIELVGGIGVHAGLKFREALPADLPIHTLMPQDGWRDVGKFKLARLVWAKLNELDPEVVLVPGYYTLPGLAIAVWARVHGAVSVLMTESTAYDHGRMRWKEFIKGLGLRLLFDWAVAGGKAHIEYLHQLGFPPERIVNRYDVVDNRFFTAGAAALRAQPGATTPLHKGPFFLYVGRLAPEKNVGNLLESWIAYRAGGGSWPLVLVGEGPEASALRENAANSAYGGEVHFPGLKSSAELLPFYAAAGCFVLPSTREPWGLVVNEAMAAGLPVLVSDRCGCAPDLVVEGKTGFVFSPIDQTNLTHLLLTMEQLSPEQRQQMGSAAAEHVMQFSPEGFGASIAQIYVRTTGESKRALSNRTELSPAKGDAQ